jgi:hypothetical protein
VPSPAAFNAIFTLASLTVCNKKKFLQKLIDDNINLVASMRERF